MPTAFISRFSFKGENGKIVHRYWDLGTLDGGTPGGDYDLAVTAVTALHGDLTPIIDSTITKVTLTAVPISSALPGAGDVFENALLNLYLDNQGEKVTQLYIPAPKIGIFLAASGPNRDVIDTGNADLIAFVDEVATNLYVSDGEQVDTTVNNGMKNGVRDIRDMQLGK